MKRSLIAAVWITGALGLGWSLLAAIGPLGAGSLALLALLFVIDALTGEPGEDPGPHVT